MTVLELQLFLDDLSELSFLSAILEINKKEKQYKNSEFFKQTRIPLLSLYEKYLQYVTLSKDRIEEIALAIESLDLNRFSDKLAELVLKTLDKETIQKRIEEFSKDFNLEELLEQNEELEEIVNKLKE